MALTARAAGATSTTTKICSARTAEKHTTKNTVAPVAKLTQSQSLGSTSREALFFNYDE